MRKAQGLAEWPLYQGRDVRRLFKYLRAEIDAARETAAVLASVRRPSQGERDALIHKSGNRNTPCSQYRTSRIS